MLKPTIKSISISLILLSSSQLTFADKKVSEKKNFFSCIKSACEKVFPCFTKKATQQESEKRLLKRKESSEQCLRQISMKEYETHPNDQQAWVLINGVVYDVTDFIDQHPGGGEHITKLFGKDATKDFENFSHTSDMFEEYGVKAVGRLIG